MPTARDVASELRKFADSLEKNPEAIIVRPNIRFWHWNEKDRDLFLAEAPLLPRPIQKIYDDTDFKLKYETGSISIWAEIPRSAVCRLITPAQDAVYECDPILSDSEMEEVGRD